MKKTLLLFAAVLPLVSAIARSVPYDSLAKVIVHRSLAVKPGEAVYVMGDEHTRPLMEQIVNVCRDVGAKVYPRINPDNIEASESMNTFIQHQFSTPEKLIEFLDKADACIVLTPFNKHPKWLLRDFHTETVSAERPREVNDALARTRVRMLYVSYPTQAFAEGRYVPYDEYATMTMDANLVDGTELSARMAKLKATLATARQIRITTKSGSNLVLSAAGRPVVTYDGKVAPSDAASTLHNKIDRLPAGLVEVSVIEQSASGKLVVPLGECEYEAYTDATLTFVAGKLQQVTAGGGADCLKFGLTGINAANGVVAGISFGFNPLLKPITTGGGLYWPDAAAGTVTITLGGNQFLGGQQPADTPEFVVTLTDATVTVDGKVVLTEAGL